VYHVEFSPRADTLASCGNDGTVRLWDPQTGRLKRVLRGHNGDVNWVAFSPDGSKLGTGGDDGTVRLWDLSGDGDPKPVTLGKHDDWVTCVLFTPDGRRLLSTGRDGHVKVWAAETGRMLRSVTAHAKWIEGMALSPDGRILATASADHTVKLWNAETFQERRALSGHGGNVQSVAFSHSGQRLASGGFDQSIKLWNTSRGEALETGKGHRSIVECVAFSPDDQLLVSCGDDASIRIWDARTALLLGIYRAEPSRLWCVTFSRDGHTLASCGNDGAIRLWDIGAPRDRVVLRLPVSRVDSVASPPVSNELIIAGPPKEGGHGRESVSSWDLRQGVLLRVGQIAAPREVSSCILSPDGRTLTTLDASRILQRWDLTTGSPRESVRLPEAGAYAFSGSEGSRVLLTMVNDNSKSPLLWDLGTRAGVLRLRGDVQDGAIASAIDRNCVVIGSFRGLFRWDLAADQVTHVERPPHTFGPWMYDLTVSRDGRHLASSPGDGPVQLWNARTLEWEATLVGHSTHVVCLDFSPDGKTLASASEDGVIKLWDVSTRLELVTLEGVRGDADGRRHLRFSFDGSALVYCFSDRKQGAAIVWPGPRDDEIHGQFRFDPRRPPLGDFGSHPIGSSQ
jgi:WD40 repeat protein